MIAGALYKIKRSLINTYCLIIDTFVYLPAKKNRLSNTRKKILIIKTDNIGDFILWSDAGKEYQKLFPAEQYELTLLGNNIWTSLARKTNYFNIVISLNRKKFMLYPVYRIKKMKEILNHNWYKVIYHSFSHEFGTGLSILRLIKADEIIAAPSDDGIDYAFWRNKVQKKISHTVSIAPDETHELKKNGAFMRGLGHSSFEDAIPDLKFLCLPLKETLPNAYYVIFPGASSPARKWKESNFIELCNYIHNKTGLFGIVCGGKSEIAIAENIVTKSNAKLISLAGKTTLEEFLTVLQSSAFTVTNETSCTHMAAAVNASVICILGGGHFGRFLPFPPYKNRKIPISVYHKMNCFNCNWNCIYKPTKFQEAPCVEHISLKQVIQAVDALLEKQ